MVNEEDVQHYIRLERAGRRKRLLVNALPFLFVLLTTMGGAGLGALLGTLVFPGVGTAVGAILGGTLGGFAGLLGVDFYRAKVGQGFFGGFLFTATCTGLAAIAGGIVGTFIFPGIGTALGVAIFAAAAAAITGSVALYRYNNEKLTLPVDATSPELAISEDEQETTTKPAPYLSYQDDPGYSFLYNGELRSGVDSFIDPNVNDSLLVNPSSPVDGFVELPRETSEQDPFSQEGDNGFRPG